MQHECRRWLHRTATARGPRLEQTRRRRWRTRSTRQQRGGRTAWLASGSLVRCQGLQFGDALLCQVEVLALVEFLNEPLEVGQRLGFTLGFHERFGEIEI